jgi:NADH:ubiquinone oxidoreductase subunit E
VKRMPGKTLEKNPVRKNEALILEEVDRIIAQYRDHRGSLIQILHLVQESYGYLPLEVQKRIAVALDIPLSEVSGVVTFYSFFSEKPRGLHIIRVCLGTACYVRGGKKIVDHLLHALNVELGETTSDGRFTFEVARCIGACGLAPAMMIDGEVYKQVNVNKVNAILAKYGKE